MKNTAFLFYEDALDVLLSDLVDFCSRLKLYYVLSPIGNNFSLLFTSKIY